jgi:outer membrane murein-binding lipoprotein Lpp
MTYRKLMNIILVAGIFLTGCSQEIEMEKIGELNRDLAKAEENLNFDSELFINRKAIIESNLQTIQNLYTDTLTLELTNQLERYKVIKKIYSKKLGKYGELSKELEELKTQTANLETDLKNRKFSKEQFKTHLRTERNDIDKLLLESEGLKKSFYELEPDYQRIAKIVDALLASMETEN